MLDPADYTPLLTRIMWTHARSLHDADRDAWEDVRQELALILIRSCKRYTPDGGAKPLTYLYKCLSKGIITARRRARFHRLAGKFSKAERYSGAPKFVPISSVSRYGWSGNDELFATDRHEVDAERRERLARVRDLFRILTDREKEVIGFRFGLGDVYGDMFSLKAIAEIMRVTPERVRQIQVSGLRRIRNVVSRSHIEYEDVA